ncbi:unnamed protein product [Meganyctiphanes norvegica]|uniref:BHLH domain-containing protein n=1 Tax=Meganyctiphanes norvegica TaxID=48144 RepID=A0AAV2PT29_MEGNR
MKAVARPAPPSMDMITSVRNGKVAKPRDTDDCEISMYMEKLKHLVPSTESSPKSQQSVKLGKLELIERVIDYIAQLQDVLEVNHQKDMDLLECQTSSITLAA